MEIWVKKGKTFKLFKIYKICYFSGGLGPKMRQGDGKNPEGFYFVKPNQLNPHSSYHLSFNIGYPNKYDRTHGYTGNYLMVHGSYISIGCYVMGNKNIEEIWTIINSSFKKEQKFFRIHIFPFRMTAVRLLKHRKNKWFNFWLYLKKGYDCFEEKKYPPNVLIKNKRYVFE